MRNECNNRINENKEFEAKLNELKRHQPNDSVICFLTINYIFQLFVLNHLLFTIVFFFLYYIR